MTQHLLFGDHRKLLASLCGVAEQREVYKAGRLLDSILMNATPDTTNRPAKSSTGRLVHPNAKPCPITTFMATMNVVSPNQSKGLRPTVSILLSGVP